MNTVYEESTHMKHTDDPLATSESSTDMTSENRRASLLEAQPAHPGDVPLNLDFPGGTSQPVDSARAQMAALAAELRAHEIMLFTERERYRDALEALRCEIEGLRQERVAMEQQQAVLRHQVAALYSSMSWRMTMPVRMTIRLLKGDWREIKRIMAAKFK